MGGKPLSAKEDLDLAFGYTQIDRFADSKVVDRMVVMLIADMAVTLHFAAMDSLADLASTCWKRSEETFLFFRENLIARSASFGKRFAVL